jgi:hypothetical protein
MGEAVVSIKYKEIGDNCDLFYLNVIGEGQKFVKPNDQKIQKRWLEKKRGVC